MLLHRLDSDFIKYLIDNHVEAGDRLPTLNEISHNLGISTGKLREQLEVARSLGFVSVKTRTGIQREPFNFAPAVLIALLFSLGTGETQFAQFSELRQAIEKYMWHDAVVSLTPTDKTELRRLVNLAWRKLRDQPAHVPNGEHRQFHLKIYSHLDNPFVQGLLSAYWDAYEASELTRFVNYQYGVDVWTFHEQIVDALDANDFDQGLILLTNHFSLLPTIPAAGNWTTGTNG
ncbi:MAG: FadR family transcriptional regulator [Chloroflexi bacterium]|nr:FadR family transcriptional regulator [Chloroflexota bacterium]